MKSGKVLVSLANSDESVYKLNDNNIIFSVIDRDQIEPQVIDFRILSLTQNSVECFVLNNEIVTLYYFIGNLIN